MLFLFAAMALSAVDSADRKTIFLDKMGGLEAFIEKAAAEQEFNAEFIEEAEHPDLKVLIGSKFKSLHAEVLYKKSTGRTEDTTLEVIDIRTKKTLLNFDFKWSKDESVRRRVASDFIRQLKSKLQ